MRRHASRWCWEKKPHPDEIRRHGHMATTSGWGNSRLAAQPATADTTAATENAIMGMVKLPVCWVTLPTAHIASAPASEPQPLNRPRAVETWVLETSWTMVRYIATQIPNPMLTATRTETA